MMFFALTATVIFSVTLLSRRRNFVKLPAIFAYEPSAGWQLKDSGIVNLERN